MPLERIKPLYSSGGFTPNNLQNLALWLDSTYGVYTDGAASFPNNVQYPTAATDYLTGSDSAFPLGSSDRTIGFWMNVTNNGANFSTAFGYGSATFNELCDLFVQNQNNGTYILECSNYGQSVTSGSNVFSYGTWYFVELKIISGVWNIYVNTVLVGSGALTTNTVSSAFYLGKDATLTPFNGFLCSFGIWNRAISGTESAALYNFGNGLLYSGLSGSLLTGLIDWYNLTEMTGTRYTSTASGNNLAMTGSVGIGGGIPQSIATNGSPVGHWIDHLGNVFSQPTYANRPIFNAGSGKPYLSFNGVNQYLTGPAYVATIGGASLAMALQPTQTSTLTVPISNVLDVPQHYAMQFIQGNYLSFRQLQDITDWIGRSTALNAINANTWYNSVNNWNGGTANASIALYLSGVEVDAADDGMGVFTAPNTYAIPTIIGAQRSAGVTNYFQGNISTVVRTGSSLTAGQIGQLSNFLAGTHA